MAGMGVVLVVGLVVASMGLSMYAYLAYQTNVVEAAAGQPVRVGPVEYVVTYEGTHGGSKELAPEHVFVKIGIVARNVGDGPTFLSGGQFRISDGGRGHEATYGGFSAEDLLYEEILPDKPVRRTTQFDIPFDGDARYSILVSPQKDQSTTDTASVCITNC